ALEAFLAHQGAERIDWPCVRHALFPRSKSPPAVRETGGQHTHAAHRWEIGCGNRHRHKHLRYRQRSAHPTCKTIRHRFGRGYCRIKMVKSQIPVTTPRAQVSRLLVWLCNQKKEQRTKNREQIAMRYFFVLCSPFFVRSA